MKKCLASACYGSWLLAAVLCYGCHAREAVELFQDPEFQERLGNAINKVVTQPANPFPWLELVSTVGGLVVTGVVGSKVYDSAKAKKKAKALKATTLSSAPSTVTLPAK